MPPNVDRVAVVLAAGLASRMGFRPKPLLEREGVSLLRRLALALQACDISELVVVTGPQSKGLEQALSGLKIRWATNPDPAQGQAQSLQCGLRALPFNPPGAMIALADMPLIETTDLQALWLAFDERPSGIDLVRPCQGAAMGNPVVISQRLFEAWRDAPEPVLGQVWQRQHPDRVLNWTTNRPAFFFDVDGPEDLERLRTIHHLHLKWPDAP